jgi:hypothetical protein
MFWSIDLKRQSDAAKTDLGSVGEKTHGTATYVAPLGLFLSYAFRISNAASNASNAASNASNAASNASNAFDVIRTGDWMPVDVFDNASTPGLVVVYDPANPSCSALANVPGVPAYRDPCYSANVAPAWVWQVLMVSGGVMMVVGCWIGSRVMHLVRFQGREG